MAMSRFRLHPTFFGRLWRTPRLAAFVEDHPRSSTHDRDGRVERATDPHHSGQLDGNGTEFEHRGTRLPSERLGAYAHHLHFDSTGVAPGGG